MRLVFALLAVVLLMQISNGGRCGRYKRSTYVETHLKDFIAFAKRVVKQSATIVTAVMDKLPATGNYSEYREELEAYLHKLDQYKKRSGRCATKSFEVMTAFLLLTEPFEQENITSEAKEVYTIMNKNGLELLEHEAERWMDTFDENRFKEEYEELLAGSNNTAVSSLFSEIC